MDQTRFSIKPTNEHRQNDKYIIRDSIDPNFLFLTFNDCDIDDIIQQLQKIKENNKIEPIMEQL